MKKTIVGLLALLLVILSIHVYAEEDQKASLTIGYFPTDLCGRYTEYTPDEDIQQQILDLLSDIDFIDMSNDSRAFPDYREVSLGISLSYDGYTADLRTGGWIRRHENDGLGIWFAQDERISGQVIDLLAKYGYEPFNPSAIKHIVSAELSDGEYYTGQAHDSIVISDPVKLENLEALIACSALAEPSGCPFGYAKLVIIDSEGSRFELYPATDSCCRYFINGSFFNYDTKSGSDNHDSNQILFDLFGIEPFDYFHNVR